MNIKHCPIFILTLIVLYFCPEGNTQTQTDKEIISLSERVDDTKNKLQLKLLLSKEQLISIDTILAKALPKSISKENREETINAINRRVETVLTERQKTKFNILKSKWLDEILGTSE